MTLRYVEIICVFGCSKFYSDLTVEPLGMFQCSDLELKTDVLRSPEALYHVYTRNTWILLT